MADEAIYADLPEDDIYADLEDELNKAGYGSELRTTEVAAPAPALPTRNQTALPAKDMSRPGKESSLKRVKKEKGTASPQSLRKEIANKKLTPTKKNPPQTMMGGPMISKDMLSQRTLLKKVERIDQPKNEDSETKIDFRANLRKVNRNEDKPKQPPPKLKPKPSRSSISIEHKKICYKRKPLSQVDLSNPPVIDRDKKPKLILDTDNYDENLSEDDVYDDVTNIAEELDVYDDVENVTGTIQVNGDELDVYDDVENMNPDLMGEYDDVDSANHTHSKSPELYDDVENVGITRNKSPDLYDDVENVGITRNKSPDLYDDIENVGIIRNKSPELYDDVENVGITRGQSPDVYDDVENVGSQIQSPGRQVINEDVYDEVPETAMQQNKPRPKLSAAQEKKRKAEELKFRKRQLELEKKRQKEMEKNAKELEKKRKVFFDYYNIKESDKPLMVAQVTSENDLRGKQNLEVDVGEIVHVLCKQHKKMPKGAWLAEKADRSAIGFIAPHVLNQNMLPSYTDETLYSTTD